MTNMTNGCKWAVGAAVSIWFAAAGNAQARVFILDDPYNPGEQAVVELQGCRDTEARLERLLPLLKQRQTNPTSVAAAPSATAAPSVRVAMASPVRTGHVSMPLMIGVGY